MISFFTGIWPKITAAFAAVIGLMFIRAKYQADKIEDLEHENKIIEKESEIKTEQAEFKAGVVDAEQEKIDEVVVNDENESNFDRLNKH